jgi:hypothetical protein
MTTNVAGHDRAELIPEKLARLLFNKLVKTYPLVSKEWRERRQPLLLALIDYEYDPTIADKMRGKLVDAAIACQKAEAAE